MLFMLREASIKQNQDKDPLKRILISIKNKDDERKNKKQDRLRENFSLASVILFNPILLNRSSKQA